VLAADNVERLGRLTRSYQLVEGVVAQVGQSGARIYLNSTGIGGRISPC
jgi:hypothetical protein